MSLFLKFIFIFFLGSTLGYILELFFRRLNGGKWINPGFLMGPYLPIYGFGLCTMTFIYMFIYDKGFSPVVAILSMGVAMTVIELIGGLIFIKGAGIKLWDYSNNFLNYKGIICPLFSIIWTLIGAVYYFFVADKILYYLNWYSNHLEFSFVLGMFFAIIIIDFVYSSKIMVFVRKYAYRNKMIIRYEELKRDIRDGKNSLKEKSSFIFPFRGNLVNYLDNYKKKINKEFKSQNVKGFFCKFRKKTKN